MLTALVVLSAVSVALQFYVVWILESRPILKRAGHSSHVVSQPRVNKITAYTPGKNRIIARTEEQEAEIEERQQTKAGDLEF